MADERAQELATELARAQAALVTVRAQFADLQEGNQRLRSEHEELQVRYEKLCELHEALDARYRAAQTLSLGEVAVQAWHYTLTPMASRLSRGTAGLRARYRPQVERVR